MPLLDPLIAKVHGFMIPILGHQNLGLFILSRDVNLIKLELNWVAECQGRLRANLKNRPNLPGGVYLRSTNAAEVVSRLDSLADLSVQFYCFG